MKPDKKFCPTPPGETKSVTVIVAARDEAGNLPHLMQALEQTWQDLGFFLPVLLIDDGSRDESAEVLANLSSQFKFLQVIHHPRSQGLTHVIKTALTHTSSDWLYLMPADLESDPRIDLSLLLQACGAEIDAVAGWRQERKDGKVLASTVANWVCRLTFGLNIHDMNWIKLVRRDVLLLLPLEKVTHAYLLPVMAGSGYRVIEVKTPWQSRKAGKSKFGTKRLLTSGIKFWKLWWWFYFKGGRDDILNANPTSVP